MYLTACSWVLLKTFRVVQFDQDTLAAYDTRTFQYAVQSSKSLVAVLAQKNAVHKFTRKMCGGELHLAEVKRHAKAEDFYAVYSVYNACTAVRLIIIKVCKHFRFTLQHCKVYSRRTYCGWKRNRNWKSPTSGTAIDLLLD